MAPEKRGPVLELTPAEKRRGLDGGILLPEGKRFDHLLGSRRFRTRSVRAEVQIRARTPRQTKSIAKYSTRCSPKI